MKAIVWVKHEELEASDIKEVHSKCPRKESREYVQVSMEVDEYIQIREQQKELWLKEQWNRNRKPENWK